MAGDDRALPRDPCTGSIALLRLACHRGRPAIQTTTPHTGALSVMDLPQFGGVRSLLS
jgi:hypothetical protein